MLKTFFFSFRVLTFWNSQTKKNDIFYAMHDEQTTFLDDKLRKLRKDTLVPFGFGLKIKGV